MSSSYPRRKSLWMVEPQEVRIATVLVSLRSRIFTTAKYTIQGDLAPNKRDMPPRGGCVARVCESGRLKRTSLGFLGFCIVRYLQSDIFCVSGRYSSYYIKTVCGYCGG